MTKLYPGLRVISLNNIFGLKFNLWDFCIFPNFIYSYFSWLYLNETDPGRNSKSFDFPFPFRWHNDVADESVARCRTFGRKSKNNSLYG